MAVRRAYPPRGRKAARLQAWRIRRNMTQVELAAVAGVTPQTVSSAERGRMVTFATLKQLAAALNVEPMELYEAENAEAVS